MRAMDYVLGDDDGVLVIPAAEIESVRARPVAGAVPDPEYGAIAWRPQQSAGRSSR